MVAASLEPHLPAIIVHEIFCHKELDFVMGISSYVIHVYRCPYVWYLYVKDHM
jgi:hypothetical protein